MPERDRYLDRINSDSPLEVFLRGHLWIEAELTRLLHAAIPVEGCVDVARLTFNQKARWVCALGVYPKLGLGALQAINRVRNRLAHDLDHEVTEADEEDLVRSLAGTEAQVVRKFLTHKGVVDPFPETSRVIITSVLSSLQARAQLVEEAGTGAFPYHFDVNADTTEDADALIKEYFGTA